MQLYCGVSNAKVPIRLFGEGASSSWSDGTYEPFLEIKFQMERKYCRKKNSLLAHPTGIKMIPGIVTDNR
jgi:hypothetical protein